MLYVTLIRDAMYVLKVKEFILVLNNIGLLVNDDYSHMQLFHVLLIPYQVLKLVSKIKRITYNRILSGIYLVQGIISYAEHDMSYLALLVRQEFNI